MSLYANSAKAFEEAKQYIPGGVNSPVRAFKNVGTHPLFFEKAQGAYLYDVDKNRYVDYCLSWGVAIAGHSNNTIVKAATEALLKGSTFGAPTLYETQLAKFITQQISAIERVRFVSSGTEAVMSAVRLARGFTGRKTIIKFDGCYHGHSDSLLVAAGSGVAHTSKAGSKGVPDVIVKNTLSLPFNNSEALIKAFEKHGNDVAAVVLEVVPANMGLIIPEKQFLQTIQHVTKQFNALIIADEVITGFRYPEGSAHKRYGLVPDLVTLGKIIGGGFPAAAFGGKKEIMELLAPNGSVYQAGTLSGNPVAMAAGYSALQITTSKDFKQEINSKWNVLSEGLKHLSTKYSYWIGMDDYMFSISLAEKEIKDFKTLNKHANTALFAWYYQELLQAGIYLSPSLYETNFLSVSHSNEDINQTLTALEEVFIKLKKDKGQLPHGFGSTKKHK